MDERSNRDEREAFLRVWQRVNAGRESAPEAEDEAALLRRWAEELGRWRGLCCRCLAGLDCPMAQAQRRLSARLYLATGAQIPLRRTAPEGAMDELSCCRRLYLGLRQAEAALRGRQEPVWQALAQDCAAWAAQVERRTERLMGGR